MSRRPIECSYAYSILYTHGTRCSDRKRIPTTVFVEHGFIDIDIMFEQNYAHNLTVDKQFFFQVPNHNN